MPTLPHNKPLNKSAQVLVALRDLAEEAGPDGKLPTYSTLIEQLGVSRTTLNTALDELESQRVIYRRHGVGIYAASLRTESSIALVCNPLFFKGSSHSPFWDVLLREARDRAEADELSCEVHFSKTQRAGAVPFSENLINALEMGRIQGVLGVGLAQAADFWLREKNISYVSFGGAGSYYIGIDMASLIQQGVQSLAASGCRRLAMLSPVGPYKQHTVGEDIWSPTIEVFRMALSAHGLPFDMRQVKLNVDLIQESGGLTTLTHQEQGYRTAQHIFGDTSAPVPDGLLITNDLMTAGVLAALQELNIQPANDIQIVTHANRGTEVLTPWAAVLARLEIDPFQIVDIMFSSVLDLIGGKPPSGYMFDPVNQAHRILIQPVLQPPVESLEIAQMMNASTR